MLTPNAPELPVLSEADIKEKLHRHPEWIRDCYEEYAESAKTVPDPDNRKHAEDPRRADFSDSQLERKDWHEVDARGANFSGSVFPKNANLFVAHLEHADLFRAHLEKANLHGAHLEHAFLFRANLEHADLSWAGLEFADMREVYLENAHLSFAQLKRAELSGAHLVHVDLNGANLEGADLSLANLVEVNLFGTNLKGSNLSEATMTNVFAREADFSGAHFIATKIRSCDFSYAIFRGAVVETFKNATD